MRKIYLILAAIFTIISVITSILPLDTIALLPIGIALIFAFLCLYKSENKSIQFPKILLLLCGLCSVYVMAKTILIKDEVQIDKKFEQQKIETKKEAQKELEDLEGL